ncbi:transglycosylase SLT domain-containing protein [Bacillus manliponensis]|uniref:transglycosylase SLT domain-containing protein n=1 Tax=Bacillus manliponensis TaxID=574376 RepID=UPI003514BE4B
MKKFFVIFLVFLGIYMFFRNESEGIEQEQYLQSEEVKEIKQIITEEAKKHNVPEWIPLTIAEHESRFNPRAIGDNGTSFGLFQLHRGGGLAPEHLTDEQLKDPRTNAEIAMPHLARGYRKGMEKGLTAFELLKYTANTTGWPGNLGPEWTDANMKYNVGLKDVYYRNMGVMKE